MDWFLYGNSLRLERVKLEVNLSADILMYFTEVFCSAYYSFNPSYA